MQRAAVLQARHCIEWEDAADASWGKAVQAGIGRLVQVHSVVAFCSAFNCSMDILQRQYLSLLILQLTSLYLPSVPLSNVLNLGSQFRLICI